MWMKYALSHTHTHTHTHGNATVCINTKSTHTWGPYTNRIQLTLWNKSEQFGGQNQEDSRLWHPCCFKRLHVLVCVCVCVCGSVYVDGRLIEKSWWLGPCIKGLRRSRTASGSNNVASNPSLPQRLGPGWQPTAIFTTLLLTSLRFSFPPFFYHSPIEFCLLKKKKKLNTESISVSLTWWGWEGTRRDWSTCGKACLASPLNAKLEELGPVELIFKELLSNRFVTKFLIENHYYKHNEILLKEKNPDITESTYNQKSH